MRSPNKHGIDNFKLRLPKGGWRIIVLFRNLQPLIKKQAEAHKMKCNNDDANVEMMEKCECYKIK